MRHGASAYRQIDGCRCDVCTEAHRVLQNAESASRRARRVLTNGRLVAPVPPERHGRYTTYRNWGCQCQPCVKAGSENNALRTAPKGLLIK